MKTTCHSSLEQRSDGWFNQRKGRITASAVGAIMGLAPYQTRGDVMRRMVREYFGLGSEFKGNAATEWGTFHEDGAIFELEMETGLKVDTAYFVEYELDGVPCGASPDGYVGDSLLEVKCPYGLRDEKNPEFKTIYDQPHYHAQVQMQMLCTGADNAYFFQWSPHGTKLEEVKRDQFSIDMICEAIEEFYKEYLEIIAKDQHELKQYLEPKVKDHSGNEELEKMMVEYQKLKKAETEIKERMKAILNGMVTLTDGEGGKIGEHSVYKVNRAGAISYAKAIKDLLPDADMEPYRGKPSEYWAIK